MSETDRITRLETHFEYVREGLTDLKGGQKELNSTLGLMQRSLEQLPTKDDLWAWRAQWIVIGIGAVALIVGGIIGGLDWIKVH